MSYVLDNKAEREFERLEALEAWGDPITVRRLQSIGVREGWRCLEIGGGGGSVARWLCEHVGPTGRVVATDIESKLLEAIRMRNFEARRHDIANDPLEEGSFDLVHARAVLEHLPRRDLALGKMAAALKSGGWLLVEDLDHLSFVQVRGGNEELYKRVDEAFWQVFTAAGMDRRYGLKLGALLREQGLVDVHFEGEVAEWGGLRTMTKVWLLAWERLRDRVAEAGQVSDADIDAFLALVQDPEFVAISPINCGAWGRKLR